MKRVINTLTAAFVIGVLAVGGAAAQPRATESTTPQVPRCTRNVGTISIQNGGG